TQEALYIVVNAPNERLRFRYLHMLPKQFNADGLVSGRFVHEGEVIGKVGNFARRERATTYHLHFDLQAPTKSGWVFVNPYMTPAAWYERLTRGRGKEIKEQDVKEAPPTASIPVKPLPAMTLVPPANAAAKPTETAVESPPPKETGIRRDERVDETSPVKASLPVHAGGRPGNGERNGTPAGQQTAIRPH